MEVNGQNGSHPEIDTEPGKQHLTREQQSIWKTAFSLENVSQPRKGGANNKTGVNNELGANVGKRRPALEMVSRPEMVSDAETSANGENDKQQ